MPAGRAIDRNLRFDAVSHRLSHDASRVDRNLKKGNCVRCYAAQRGIIGTYQRLAFTRPAHAQPFPPEDW
jgi:hypothetical protein